MPRENAEVLIAKEILPPGQVTTILDWMPVPQFGFPFWVVLAIALFVTIIAVVIYWWKRSSRLNSVKGWLTSLRSMGQGDVQVWIISRIQKLTIECLRIKDNILSYPDELNNISIWHINSSMGVIRVGGNPAVVISEEYDQNRDLLTEIAICTACDKVNENITDLSEKLNGAYKTKVESGELSPKSPNPAELCVPITDSDVYDVTGRKLLQNIYPENIPIPSYNNFDPNRFQKYFPRGCSAMFFGGELIEDARRLNQNEDKANWIDKNIPLFIAVVFVLIVMAFAFYLPLK